jgi:hypothetical protein
LLIAGTNNNEQNIPAALMANSSVTVWEKSETWFRFIFVLLMLNLPFFGQAYKVYQGLAAWAFQCQGNSTCFLYAKFP